MKVVLDSGQINASIAKLTDSIASLASAKAEIAIIGIRCLSRITENSGLIVAKHKDEL